MLVSIRRLTFLTLHFSVLQIPRRAKACTTWWLQIASGVFLATRDSVLYDCKVCQTSHRKASQYHDLLRMLTVMPLWPAQATFACCAHFSTAERPLPCSHCCCRARNCVDNNWGVNSTTFGQNISNCNSCPLNMVTSTNRTGYPNSASYYVDNGDGRTGGFTSKFACVNRPGYGFNGRWSFPCDKGSFNNEDNWSDCTVCGSGLTTIAAGQGVTSADCGIAPGYGFHSSAIVLCPQGMSCTMLVALVGSTLLLEPGSTHQLLQAHMVSFNGMQCLPYKSSHGGADMCAWLCCMQGTTTIGPLTTVNHNPACSAQRGQLQTAQVLPAPVTATVSATAGFTCYWGRLACKYYYSRGSDQTSGCYQDCSLALLDT